MLCWFRYGLQDRCGDAIYAKYGIVSFIASSIGLPQSPLSNRRINGAGSRATICSAINSMKSALRLLRESRLHKTAMRRAQASFRFLIFFKDGFDTIPQRCICT